MPVKTEAITPYAVGICNASVCAPFEATVEAVERATNYAHPTGLDHGWKKAEENFIGGEDNPCPCSHDSARQHWLLVC